MYIFAHRGLKLVRPENTLEAFKAAADLGFGIELDVRLTKDGQLICLHNPDTEHITGTKLVVRESTVDQLQQLDVKEPGYKIPRFLDVVEQVMVNFKPGQKAAIHVKADEQGEQQLAILLETFKTYQLHDKALLFDLTLESCQLIRNADPKIELAISVGEENYSPTIYTLEQAMENLQLFDVVWWDEWKIPGSMYTKEIAERIHSAGKRIYAISPELHTDHGHPHAKDGYQQDWKNFIAWGIEGVCTAYPKGILTTSLVF
ncbi:MAG: hypothetical protein A3C04_03660 [Candidatus Wildermuthbacteria bacterium RIFCSPHIGHO2_02_FULL_45_25]|uniref:GP-PDE domain-containing protein n=1 Tax=Candidatus Wildermuthbacteria bacterium RIFCSPHIGHO2_02_FULL_45_25 TaxID=1802450 RepID=A0A1G2R1S5_9BACT|nr:MAG: hypothetical protein A3C04_03660 [Candidatus Wildermuthbacteria bacterium RIFCSPHIGHO2_02_FULL_45_25]